MRKCPLLINKKPGGKVVGGSICSSVISLRIRILHLFWEPPQGSVVLCSNWSLMARAPSHPCTGKRNNAFCFFIVALLESKQSFPTSHHQQMPLLFCYRELALLSWSFSKSKGVKVQVSV